MDNKKDHAANFIAEFTKGLEAGTLPTAIAKATINRNHNAFVPSDSWSILNQVRRVMALTDDARGFKAWLEAGRQVKKGASAFYIMAPLAKQITDKDEQGNETKKTALYGFKWLPVFRYEDTEGNPLPDRPEINIPLPALAPVAQSWGLAVDYRPFNGQFYGSYLHGKSITLATPDEQTFFHELAHAADDKLGTITKKQGQQADNEIVAELAAATLMFLYGRSANTGYTGNYLKSYAGNANNAVKAISALIKRIDAVVTLIMTEADAMGIAA